MSTMSSSVNEYLVVAANPRPPKLSGQWVEEGYRLTIKPDVLSREIKGYRVYRTDRSGQNYQEIAFVSTPAAATVPVLEPIDFVVKDIKKGRSGFFAVRAQEYSGLISRYSNDVSANDKSVAQHIESELLDFVGFKQGFDPQAASDMYYLFVPKDGVPCSVGVSNPLKESHVWARVAGKDVAFSVNGTDSGKRTYDGWQWVNLGRMSGEVKIASQSARFKLDRIFITPDKTQTPVGKGLDYQPNAAFAARLPAEVKAKALTPFAAEITWKTVPGARYYNVYAAARPDFAPIQSNLLYSPPVGTERTVDWGLRPGSTYYYKVVAVDYDGTASRSIEPVAVKTQTIATETIEVPYASGKGGTVEEDQNVSHGKAVLLDKDQTCELKFRTSAAGDFVVWQQWRADSGRPARCKVTLDGQSYTIQETYDLTALRGKALAKDWVWSRYTFQWSRNKESILCLKPGEHTLRIAPQAPIHLDKLVITNDQSFLPAGKLCTF